MPERVARGMAVERFTGKTELQDDLTLFLLLRLPAGEREAAAP